MRLGLFALFKFFKTPEDAMTKLQLFLAQAAPASPAGAGGNPTFMLVGYGLLMVALYFFMIAPQNKKRKEHEKMLAELKSGDEVVTAPSRASRTTGLSCASATTTPRSRSARASSAPS